MFDAFLLLAFLPFVLLYYYIKWCIQNNTETCDRPIYLRTWFITTIVLIVFFSIAGITGNKRDVQPDTATPVATATPTPEPTPEITPEPTAEPTPEPTDAQEQQAAVAVYPNDAYLQSTEDYTRTDPVAEASLAEEEPPVTEQAVPQENMVWIAGSGEGTRYHCDPSCSNMSNPVQVTLEDSVTKGYTACKRCY